MFVFSAQLAEGWGCVHGYPLTVHSIYPLSSFVGPPFHPLHNNTSEIYLHVFSIITRVSFETSFDSKQPKLEPKLVSALSETKCLFRLFRFYTETESFDVLIEPKQTEDQPKQFDREHILISFTNRVSMFQLNRNKQKRPSQTV
jgi:hypothetical protein